MTKKGGLYYDPLSDLFMGDDNVNNVPTNGKSVTFESPALVKFYEDEKMVKAVKDKIDRLAKYFDENKAKENMEFELDADLKKSINELDSELQKNNKTSKLLTRKRRSAGHDVLGRSMESRYHNEIPDCESMSRNSGRLTIYK